MDNKKPQTPEKDKDLSEDDKTKLASEKGSEHEVQNQDDDDFNFGGLPNRDLKKNLGCGG